VNEAHIARVYNYWLGGKDHCPMTATWPARAKT